MLLLKGASLNEHGVSVKLTYPLCSPQFPVLCLGTGAVTDMAKLPYNRSTTFYYGGSQWLEQIFASLEQMQKQIADRRE